MSFNVAIDGPAGAGKSTIAKSAAKKMSFVYVDTGAMYRSIALYMIQNKISLDDEHGVSQACDKADVTIKYENGEQHVYLNDTDISSDIRKEEVGNGASKVAKYNKVRENMVSIQKKLAANTDVIMDGRDIGTVVLPNANVKIYLTASASVRAKRRYIEYQEKNIDCDLAEIEKDIIKRDEQDMNREISPLKKADDAILVDSSNMTLDEVIQEICNIIKKHQ